MTTREAIARLLAEADGPMDAAAVAAAAGIHVTTARFHLDHLVAAGAAVSTADPAGAVGRPRLRYSPAPAARADPARRAMVAALAEALDGTADGPERAHEAGRAWAAGGGDLSTVLDRLGFAPESTEHGIRLHACPFEDAARAHPGIVCEVHRGLIEALSPDARLIPFEGPDGCLVAR